MGKQTDHPLSVRCVALCGLLLAIIGSLSEGQTYGTGHAQARGMVEGHSTLPAVSASV
jgi:hypothetical protein